MFVETIFASELDEAAIDALSQCGNRLIRELGLEQPIACVLFDGFGGEMGRFVLGTRDPSEHRCTEIEAWTGSQRGASLRMIDSNGRLAEALLVIEAVAQ